MNNILKKEKRKKKARIAILAFLEFSAIAIIAYLIIMPIFPELKYNFKNAAADSKIDFKNISEIKKITDEISQNNGGGDSRPRLPIAETRKENIKQKSEKTNFKKQTIPEPAASMEAIAETARNTLIIPKIGVKIPIIESDNEKYGLDNGAWRLPESSIPGENGNIILTGHRFKYLPPSNLTFYLFHKLEIGDIASIIWNEKTYYYRVKEIKTVGKDDISILKQTKKPTLTMYTCDPMYSTKNRLVIIAELTE